MEGKKIGILTFHRANNYGAVLQCYALQEALRSIGHSVEIIDYRQPFIENAYKPFSYKEIIKTLKNPRWYFGFLFKVLPTKILKSIKYNYFRQKHLTLKDSISKDKSITTNYDTIIIGSDQVWGLHCTGGIDETFFGEFNHLGSDIVGYGISSNIESLEEIGIERLKSYCRNFKNISFREESIRNYITENIGINSTIVLDPTLLLDKKKWETLINKPKNKGKYILTYFLHSKNNNSLTKDIKSFAAKKQCSIINIFNVAFSPTDFLYWIKNAEYIITSSYHATIFSILFEKKFYSIITNSDKDVRYLNLLKKINIIDRAIYPHEIPDTLDTEINYIAVNEKLKQLRQETYKYLNAI